MAINIDAPAMHVNSTIADIYICCFTNLTMLVLGLLFPSFILSTPFALFVVFLCSLQKLLE